MLRPEFEIDCPRLDWTREAHDLRPRSFGILAAVPNIVLILPVTNRTIETAFVRDEVHDLGSTDKPAVSIGASCDERGVPSLAHSLWRRAGTGLGFRRNRGPAGHRYRNHTEQISKSRHLHNPSSPRSMLASELCI